MPCLRHLKLLALWLLRAIGLFRLGRWLTRDGLMILGWHGVSQEDEHTRFSSLYISPETFQRRLAYLQKHFQIIDLDEALKQSRDGKFKPHQLVLTFDDGYFNFYSHAAPILKQYQMPATVYLVSGHMENQQPFYPLFVRDVVALSSVETCPLFFQDDQAEASLTTKTSKKQFLRKTLDHVESLPWEGDSKLQFCQELAKVLKVDGDELLEKRFWHSMNREEAKELAEQGFLLQVHTHRHRNVVDHAEEVEEEAKTCRELLEAATGKPARHFCYPTGKWQQSAWTDLRRAGMQTAVTTMLGPNFPQTSPLCWRRQLDGEDRTQLEFEFELSNLRWLFHALLHPSRWYQPSEKLTTYKLQPLKY
ncbi:Hypothetical protein PBC10988_24170 [Planctomycetales bacterium 10988]|nr:Hypothetical protein PBC10988_24170 [Planctomycetales bacterium 10988]